jgi:hypothetical protein
MQDVVIMLKMLKKAHTPPNEAFFGSGAALNQKKYRSWAIRTQFAAPALKMFKSLLVRDTWKD